MNLKTLVVTATCMLGLATASSAQVFERPIGTDRVHIDRMLAKMYSKDARKLRRTTQFKESIPLYRYDQSLIDDFVERYYGVHPKERILYFTHDLLDAKQQLRNRSKPEIQTRIEYVSSPVTDADIRSYLQKTKRVVVSSKQLAIMKNQLETYAATSQNSKQAHQRTQTQYEQLQEQFSSLTKQYEVSQNVNASLQEQLASQRAQYSQQEQTVQGLLHKIDSLEATPPITRKKISQELYVSEEELPEGTLSIEAYGRTLVFPNAQYVCEREEKRLVCMNLRDVLKQNQ